MTPIATFMVAVIRAFGVAWVVFAALFEELVSRVFDTLRVVDIRVGDGNRILEIGAGFFSVILKGIETTMSLPLLSCIW